MYFLTVINKHTHIIISTYFVLPYNNFVLSSTPICNENKILRQTGGNIYKRKLVRRTWFLQKKA